MNISDRTYERLTPPERFRAAMAAFGRKDWTEVDRLKESAPMIAYRVQEPEFFEHFQQLVQIYFVLVDRVRNSQIRLLVGFGAMSLRGAVQEHLDDLRGGDDPDPNEAERTERYSAICTEGIAELKSIEGAWKQFCNEIGISAEDVTSASGISLFGCFKGFEFFEKSLERLVPMNEVSYQDALAFARELWKSRFDS